MSLRIAASLPGFCDWCSTSTLVAKAGYALYRKIVADCKDYVEFVWPYGIGEPMIHPKIFELIRIASEHGLKIISIEQLIAHRRVSEKLVTRVAGALLPTRYGKFDVYVYGVQFEDQEPIAIVTGDLLAPGPPPLVRMSRPSARRWRRRRKSAASAAASRYRCSSRVSPA
jgi:hypothetical protein